MIKLFVKDSIKNRIVAFFVASVMLFSILPPMQVRAEDELLEKTSVAGMPYSDWLSYMPDDIPISRINMPASHDSGCNEIMAPVEFVNALLGISIIPSWLIEKITGGQLITAAFAKTQSHDITYQLNHGVRMFDIRGAYEKSDPEKLMINHKLTVRRSATTSEPLLFKDVFKEIDDFLKAHPDETVIVLLASEGIPFFDEIDFGPKKADELIRNWCEKDFPGWNRFDYYPQNSQVPTLGKVRGRCVVLFDIDGSPLTFFENHYDVSIAKKYEYVKNFFKTHNNGDSLRSNTLAMYKKDIFKNEGMRNNLPGGDETEGEPMVKLVNYSANNPPLDLPLPVASLIKPEFGKDSYFKSEVRYGWIGNDFVGLMSEPTDGIITSNIGCSNYYVTIEADDESSLDFDDSDFMLYNHQEGAKPVPLDQSFIKDKYSYIKVGNKLEISFRKLPLYDANGVRYEYEFGLNNEIYSLQKQSHNKDTKYQVIGDMWCGQQVSDVFSLSKAPASTEIEVQWIYDKQFAKPGVFQEPDTKDKFMKYLRGITLKQNKTTDSPTAAGKDIWVADKENPKISEYTAVSDGVYKVKIDNLPKLSKDRDLYRYGAKKILLTGEFDYIYEVVPGTNGLDRIVITAYLNPYIERYPGNVSWNDGNDAFGLRNNAFYDKLVKKDASGNIYLETLRQSRYYLDHKEPVYLEKISHEKEKTSFQGFTAAYDPSDDKYDKPGKCQFPETIGSYFRTNWDPGHYSAGYDLQAQTDLTVVWNCDASAIPTPYKDGLAIRLDSGYTTAEGVPDEVILSATAVNGWKSNKEKLKLFKSSSSEYYYKLNTTGPHLYSIATLKTNLSDFVVSVDEKIEIDNEGIVSRHFYVYCTKKTPSFDISGVVHWNDGGLPINHDASNNIKFFMNDDISIIPSLVWDAGRSHFYAYYEGGGTPKFYLKADPVEDYDLTGDASRYDKKEITDGGNYDYTYTKLVKLSIESNQPQTLSGSTIVLKQNDVTKETATGKAVFDNLPISSEDDIPYYYDVEITPPTGYYVDILSRKRDKDTGDVTVKVAFYKNVDSLELPVKLSVGGDIELSSDYKFEIYGSVNSDLLAISPISLVKAADNSYTGKFVIDSTKLKKITGTYSGDDSTGVYYFDIYQQVGSTAGVYYDQNISTVKITVTYEGDSKKISCEWGEMVLVNGKYQWVVSEADNQAKTSLFANRINYIPLRVNLNGLKHQAKVPSGSSYSLPAANFTYKLSMNDSTVQLVSVEDNGDGTAKAINFDSDSDPFYVYEPGIYTLTASAVNDRNLVKKGWYLDKKEYNVQFEVVRNATVPNKLELKNPVVYDSELVGNTITQLYAETSYQIPIKNKLNGKDSTSDSFLFTAKDELNNLSTDPDTYITGSGMGKFDPITFYEPGDYVFSIKEEPLMGGNWASDEALARYTVHVVRNADGSLSVTNDSSDAPEFVSTYINRKKEIPVTVQWIDTKGSDGVAANRPGKVDFTISKNGTVVGGNRSVTGTASENTWEGYKTEELPVYDNTWEENYYDISVNPAGLENYKVISYGSILGGMRILCIENNMESNIDIKIRTEWDDENNKAGIRPSQVSANVVLNPDCSWLFDINPQYMSAGNNWKATFKQLPCYIFDDYGNVVTLSYDLEPEILEGYNLNVYKDVAANEYVLKYTSNNSRRNEPIYTISSSSRSKYVIKFNTNGGSAINDYYAEYGEVLDLSRFITKKDRYVFAGWYLDEKLTKPVEKLTVTKDTTVYANWGSIKVSLKKIDASTEIQPLNITSDNAKESEYFVKQNNAPISPEVKQLIADAVETYYDSSADNELADESTLITKNSVLIAIGVALIGLIAAACSIIHYKKKSKK